MPGTWWLHHVIFSLVNNWIIQLNNINVYTGIWMMVLSNKYSPGSVPLIPLDSVLFPFYPYWLVLRSLKSVCSAIGNELLWTQSDQWHKVTHLLAWLEVMDPSRTHWSVCIAVYITHSTNTKILWLSAWVLHEGAEWRKLWGKCGMDYIAC